MDRRERILSAVNRIGAVLHTKGIDVADLLDKLATMAENNPFKFWSGVSFLK